MFYEDYNQAKNIYYSIQFENNKSDGRKTWRTMDNLLHRNSSKSIPDAIIVEDKLATDKGKIADAFNKYFATVCMTDENANQNFPQYDEYLKNPTDASFNFEQVENSAVLHFINKLKPSHSCGCDKISSNISKMIAKEVSHCITLIINQTLSTGIVPSKLKTAKVIPVYKKNDKTLLKNYRPISVLPVVSKIIENVMHNQMMDYFTSLGALELMDRNIDNTNQFFSLINIINIYMYIDLCKAFDCLDHAILLSKLKYYGLNDKAIKLLKKYLSDRDQYVQLGNFKSQYHISCGIPQGSVMGLLLFNIVNNDLPSAIKNFDFVMYADDTTLVSTLENFGRTCNVKEIELNINIEISKFTTWLQRNKLQLNVSKTKFIMFF